MGRIDPERVAPPQARHPGRVRSRRAPAQIVQVSLPRHTL